jgi:DNA-binding response OmpR family regulator
MGHIRLGAQESAAKFSDRLLIALDQAGICAAMFRPTLELPPAPGPFGPAVIVLEAMGSLEDALSALRHLRRASRLACVTISSHRSAEAIADLLEAGADDVLLGTEPQALAVARVRAMLRRGSWGMADGPGVDPAQPAWKLYPGRRQLVRPCGADAALTTAEYDLFRLLSSASGQTVHRDAVAAQVLRRRIDPSDRSVDNLVMRLRRKLGDEGAIKTVRSQGYLFAGFESAELHIH